MAALEIVQLTEGTIVAGRYKVMKKLGEGGFGAVYRVADERGEYAMKVEGINEPIQVLKIETTVLQEMNDIGGRHQTKLEAKGKTATYNYLVMGLVGRNLLDLRKASPSNHLSMGSAISVAQQCLEALEDLHSLGYLHRDIKPGNYTVGRPENNEARKVYILDFGMCRKFVDEKGVMKKPRKLAAFRGTVRYASIACHTQREMGRKDDLESWMYMSIEMMTGLLPWKTIQDLNEVGDYKRKCRSLPAICELFIGCPREYMTITQAIHAYKFYDPPDYEGFYRLMRQSIVSMGAKEFPYDWELPLGATL